MDELEEYTGDSKGINFIPCLKFIQRGVAKSQPDKVKLTQEELAKIIEQTQGTINDLENEDEESDNEDNPDQSNVEVENGTNEEEGSAADRDIDKIYGLDTYDDDDENEVGMALGGMVLNPRDDPYLKNLDADDDDEKSDIEDFNIKPTDNLILVGHVEGEAAILEVYVYNDVEDAFYVHHDILLPSYPMAMEWLNFDPGETTKGNLVAVGSMSPIIDVWDLDLVDSLEPIFSLGQKPRKKKKIPHIGHKDAVLSLAWNRNVDHLLASGSVDQNVLLWDMREGKVGRTIKGHEEKIQGLSWHPFEQQMLLTGCCDEKVRIYDCNQEGSHKCWKVDGEVEKVLWNHFNPYTFLVATEKGMIHMIDARQDSKPLWALSAHSEGINGMALSTQCPDCLVTGSSDQTMKVWDIANNKPTCILEKDLKIGRVHSLDNCPDAPFVFAFGGDVPSNTMKVMDIREAVSVKSRLGARELKNPMGFSSFQYKTIDEAEEVINANSQVVEMVDSEAATTAFGNLAVSNENDSGGAIAKFKKKDKKKKKKPKF